MPTSRAIVLLLVLPAALVLAQSSVRKTGMSVRPNLSQGRKIFNGQCALCHGIEGTGGRGPALNIPRLKRARTSADLTKIIREGIPDTEMPDFWAMNDHEVREVANYVRSLGRVGRVAIEGNEANGKKLFESNCASCHVVSGKGGVAGPELTEIGIRRTSAYLREALIDPNATVPEGYLMVTVVTADGRKMRGVRVNEDSFTLQLRDAGNRFVSLRKAELTDIKKEFGVSTMPSFKDAFTKTELDDLVAYLYSLRGEK